jgi:hypothetical protein
VPKNKGNIEEATFRPNKLIFNGNANDWRDE